MSQPEVRSQDWYEQQDILEREREKAGSEFGVTLADAGKLLRKAKQVWVMFPVGPGERHAIFAIPKSVVLKEIKLYQGGNKTLRPCELDHSTHGGATLIFGSHQAVANAAKVQAEGSAADARL
jgi:hypothetical protein